MRHLRLCLFLSLLVLYAGTAPAAVIVNGVEKGDSYTVSDSTDTAAVFTGTGTIIQTGSGQNPAKYTGSFTGFSGVLRLTRTTGEFWLLSGPNLVKGEGKDLEMNIAADNATLVFNDPDAENPISYRFSVLNGTGTVRTSNGTLVQTCTLILGTDTANYTPVYGNDFSGTIRNWSIADNKQSNFNLIKVGTNTQILSGNNSSGLVNVEIQGGVLEAASATALGSKNVKLNGGTLRLDQAINGINYAAASGDYTPNGTIEVNAAAGKSWDLDKYQNGADINFVKTGEGTVVMSGNRSNGLLKSAEIKEGKIQISATSSADALVFPKDFEVKVDRGACVEYLTNPGNNQNICYFLLDGGELISNTGQHLTVTNVTLKGGTMTGVGTSSTAYGNFLIDGVFIVDKVSETSTGNENLSEINADAVEFAFRRNSSREVQVNAGAQLNVNATMVSSLNIGVTNKTGEGVLNLTKANTYTGGTNVKAGTLKLTGDGTLGSGNTTVSSGATLEIGPANPIPDPDSEDETATITPVKNVANAVILNGTGYSNTGALRVMGNTNFEYITLNTDATVYVAENVTGTATREFWGKTNANTLTKTGPGTFSIATEEDKNSIKGVVIQEGVLEAASPNALGAKNVKLDGGTLRLDLAIDGINYAAASGDYTPSGTIEVNAAAGESWDLEKYQTGTNINFVKTGEGTVRMTGDYSGAALNSAEIREGKIQIYIADPAAETPENQARVFPTNLNIKIYEGACVEYLDNPKNFNAISPYSIYGGELISNIEGSHLTAGHLGLYGGTLTGVGNGSSYGSFLFDGNLTAYQTDINGGVSNINAGKVDFGFRNGNATKAIQVKEGAQLNVNAVITSAFTGGVTYITKLGGGLLVFTKANTYNLPTNVNEGTLRLSEAGTLGNASKTVTVASGATLEIANGTTVANPLTISGTGVLSAGAVNFTSDATLSGAVTLGENASINVADGKIGKLTGSVSGSSFDLTKTGAGTLKIDASQSLFDVKDLIVSEGRLDFMGNTTGGITVQDAIFSPGNSPGAATVGGAFTLSSGNSILLMEVAGTEPDQNDSLVVTGDLNLNGGLIYLELADTYSLTNGDRVTAILSRAVGTGYTPESDFIEKYVRSTIFTDLAYELLPSGLYAITATYDRNAVPEPAAWLLLALGFGGLMVWKKRMTK